MIMNPGSDAKIVQHPISIDGHVLDLEWHCPGCGIAVYYDSERFLKNFVLHNNCSRCGLRYEVTLKGDE